MADRGDVDLWRAAVDLLEVRRDPPVRTAAAALRCRSGKIVTGLNLRFAGYGACAEVVAVAAAELALDDAFERIVCVGGDEPPWRIIEPCGNCRQMLVELASSCEVLFEVDGQMVRMPITEMLAFPYSKPWRTPKAGHT